MSGFIPRVIRGPSQLEAPLPSSFPSVLIAEVETGVQEFRLPADDHHRRCPVLL